VSTIHAVAARHNTAAGIHIVEPEPQQLQARLDEGYQFLAYTVDFRALDIAFRGGVHTLESYSDQRRPSLNSEDA
jgi:2-dehydro-3-deoxyglucarate aldolase